MYITNFNLNRITKRIDIDEHLISDIFNGIDLNSCFSMEEKQDLMKAATFFRKSALGQKIQFHPIEEIKDTGTLLHESNNAAFHLNENCPRLNAKWVNFYIPTEVKSKGKATIDRFRRLVRSKISDDGTIADQSFIIFLKAEFEIGDLHFGRLERENSSAVNFSDSIERLSLDELKYQIDHLLEQISIFPTKSELHKKIYDLRYWDSYKLKRIEKNRDPNEKELADEFANLKSRLSTSVMIFCKKVDNFDQGDLDEKILLELNFKKCSECFKSQ
jgi:hypothetical protein